MKILHFYTNKWDFFKNKCFLTKKIESNLNIIGYDMIMMINDSNKLINSKKIPYVKVLLEHSLTNIWFEGSKYMWGFKINRIIFPKI